VNHNQEQANEILDWHQKRTILPAFGIVSAITIGINSFEVSAGNRLAGGVLFAGSVAIGAFSMRRLSRDANQAHLAYQELREQQPENHRQQG